MKKKVLITDPCHPILKEELDKFGYDCHWSLGNSRAEILEKIKDYYGLITRKLRVDKEVIDAGAKLGFIGRVGSGMEKIEVAYAEDKGILCFNSPEGNCDSVAEQAIASMIMLLKNSLVADRQMRHGIWERKDEWGLELGAQTVGIIGYGNTGAATAQKLSSFDCKILVYDKYKKGFENKEKNIFEVKMEQIFEESDICSLHLPLTTETNNLVNLAFLQKFLKPIWIINTSRGEVINIVDFIHFLKNGKILGGALDVFEEEPPFEMEYWDFLKQHDQLVLSPHIAGLTKNSYRKLALVLSQKITNCHLLSVESHN